MHMCPQSSTHMFIYSEGHICKAMMCGKEYTESPNPTAYHDLRVSDNSILTTVLVLENLS